MEYKKGANRERPILHHRTSTILLCRKSVQSTLDKLDFPLAPHNGSFTVTGRHVHIEDVATVRSIVGRHLEIEPITRLPTGRW